MKIVFLLESNCMIVLYYLTFDYLQILNAYYFSRHWWNTIKKFYKYSAIISRASQMISVKGLEKKDICH